MAFCPMPKLVSDSVSRDRLVAMVAGIAEIVTDDVDDSSRSKSAPSG